MRRARRLGPREIRPPVSETEVQIADDGTDQGPTPYRNLWVPLLVVPAGIVIAIVVVFALFGALSGEEHGLEENLDLVVHGGTNQSQQALFNLARQSAENQRALLAGEPLPWPGGPDFADRLQRALEEIDADQHRTRLTLAALLAGFDERGVAVLVGQLALGDGQDSDRSLRFDALSNLGQLAGAGLVRDPDVSERVVPFLGHEDDGLRTVAAAALGHLPGPAARPALIAALQDGSLQVRGTAAVALAKLEPPAPEAGSVLRDLTDSSTYEAARREDPRKYARAEEVSRFRILALEALARLGRPEDWEFIAGLSADGDANVVDAVLRLLRNHEGG